jgi:two-component system, NtrC family, response regulator AtoC
MPDSGNGLRPRILVVDDERVQADLLAHVLKGEGFETRAAYSPQDALADAKKFRPDVVISDFRMPGGNGLELFEQVTKLRRETLFIIVTAFGTLETAVEAMRRGVFDFVTKPVNTGELVLKLKKALRVRTLEDENVKLRAVVQSLREEVKVIGVSRRMREVMAAVDQIAQSHATVMIMGESGTGKELIAKAIHFASPRHAAPYVKVNCAAMPDNLLEDELFGHVRGAFTGAVSDRKGKFEAANTGTIFLDEIGDLPLHLQPKLLRVLQEREVEPLGSNEVRHVDVRVLAASNRDLRSMVDEGAFREDLYYRLNVIPIMLPALRERPEDIPALADHFLRRFADQNGRRIHGLTDQALARLAAYRWPGNVRELENCIERAVVLAHADRIDGNDFVLAGESATTAASSLLDTLFATDMTLDQVERDIIMGALSRCEGNLSKTARMLGLTRRTLQYRVEQIRKEPPEPNGRETPLPPEERP